MVQNVSVAHIRARTHGHRCDDIVQGDSHQDLAPMKTLAFHIFLGGNISCGK